MMVRAKYQPPFVLTNDIVAEVANIAERVGRWSASPGFARDLRLRRINRIRSITGSLAIEGNKLTEGQVTAILDGKPVFAPPRELLEARNALAAYEQLPQWQASNEADLLAAHRMLMLGLVDHPGHYRSSGVGVFEGDRVIHVAPPHRQVPRLMGDLMRWLEATDAHALIASSLFPYEFEFIHPFSDGNGRVGRLWQTLLLSHWNPAFAWLPVESLVHQRQTEYYQAIRDSTKATDCAPFVRFMLGCIHEAVTKVATRTTGKTTLKMIGKTLGKTPDAVLALLARNPRLTVPELAVQMGKVEVTIHRAIRKLREAGLLRRIGPDKGGRWEVIEA
jgi:Fic family protein